MDIKEDIDKLSKLIDDTKSYSNDIAIVSSKEGIKLFENWENENKNKYGMFKKVELPDSSIFPCDDKIYLIPLPSKNDDVVKYSISFFR